MVQLQSISQHTLNDEVIRIRKLRLRRSRELECALAALHTLRAAVLLQWGILASSAEELEARSTLTLFEDKLLHGSLDVELLLLSDALADYLGDDELVVRDHGGRHLSEQVRLSDHEFLALLLGGSFNDEIILRLSRFGLDGGRLAAFLTTCTGSRADTSVGLSVFLPGVLPIRRLLSSFGSLGPLGRVLLLPAILRRRRSLPAGSGLSDSTAFVQLIGAAFFLAVLVVGSAYRSDSV